MKRNITGADYEGIVAGIKRLAKTDPNFKDYDFEGSGLSSIVRLLALQGNQQAFSGNMLFNEGFLNTAEMRENAGSVASFLSYVPGSKRCSEMYVDLIVKPYSGSTPLQEVTLKTTDGFIGVKDGKTFNFMPAQDVTAQLKDGMYKFTDVKLLQGIWSSNTFNVEGSAIDSYTIPNTDIDIETLHVGVLADATTQAVTTYNRYRSAYDLGADAKLFYIQLNRSGFYELEFGDGVFSGKLKDGNIAVVNYLVTKGVEGNGITSLIPASSINGYPDITIVVKGKSNGGGEEETIDSIKHAAPLSVGRNGSAVTDGDYVVKTKELYPNAVVTSWGGELNVPPRHGYTFIAAKNADGTNFSTQAKTDLVNQLKKYNVGSVTPLVVDAEEYLINVISDVFWNPATTNIQEPAMRTKIIKDLRGWSKKELELFNTKFDATGLATRITDVDAAIRTNVMSVDYEKRYVIDDVKSQPPRKVNFHKTLAKGSVVISGFTMPPINPEVVADYSYQAKDEDGFLFIFENKSGRVTKYNDTAIGSVDYDNGIIHINPTEFKTVEEFISVKTKPATNNQNLDTVRGQILKLNDLSINMTVG
ncbi:baseplate wedge subunit [Vibrio phage D528]|nr:hypothetical protein MYOV002v2_p0195 [Vibrio phage 144E46.1]